MGDYVLESNPALERLIERLRAPGERSNSNGRAKRSRRGRRSKVHAADPEVLREAQIAARAKDPAECAPVAEPAAIVEEEPEVVEDDLWVIHDDPQPGDELVLVGFDEEPEVFDEDPEDYDEDQDEADEADEVLDVYEGEEPNSESETADVGKEVFDEEDVVLDQDEEEDVDDEVPVEVIDAFEDERPGDEQSADEYRGIVDEDAEVIDENQREGGDRMLDAFEDRRLECGDEDAVQDGEDLEAFDEDKADEFSDMFDEDTDDLVQAPEPAYEQYEVPVALLDLPVAHNEPYDSALSALSSQLIVNSGRKKARHKKQSPRQRKRSLRKAEQDARKAEKSSRKAAAKSSKKTRLPSLGQADLRAESSSVLSA